MHKQSINKKAFSMIELAVVIIIISILLGAVIAYNRMSSDATLTVARSLTKSSPVKDIDNLALWLETTMPQSVLSAEADDQKTVSTWYDLGPNHNKAIGGTTYIADAINGLPALRFNGSSDFLAFDGSLLVNSNYTIFIVASRGSNKADNMILGGSSAVANNNLHIGYETKASFVIKHYGESSSSDYINYTIPDYSDPIFQIHSVVFDSNVGKAYYENGANKANATDKTSLASWTGSAIGRFATDNYFNGDIAEIIMFNRVLSNDERMDVEQYLSKKWDIKLTS